MKRSIVVIAMVAFALGARAQVTINNTSGAEEASKIWTVADLNTTNPAVSTGNATATGVLAGAGGFSGGAEFTVTASGLYGWNTASAQGSTNAFGSYLAGLSVVGIGAINGAPFGVDATSISDAEKTAFNGTAEALVLTVDLSGVPGASMTFEGMTFHIYDGNARTDFLVYDASADAVIEARWNTYFSGSTLSGSWELAHGDKIIIATGSSNTSTKWRMDDFILDVTAPPSDTDPPTPNPAQWASVPVAAGPFSISMVASNGTDVGGVEYYFAETSGNPGGSDSGWQGSPSYTDTGLDPLTQYSYTVQLRDTLGNTGTVSVVESATPPAAPAGRTNGPPNVVFIYADDFGNGDLGYNATNLMVHTPNLDRICEEGIYLNNYMTHHVCSPSRAGVLTGRHYTEVGVGAQTGGTLDNSIPNIAKDFQAAGYATACFGKWHNSSAPETDDGNWELVSSNGQIDPYDGILQVKDTNWGEGVNAYGFDEWAGFYGGGHSYHRRINANEYDWWINSTYAPQVTGYNTDIIRDNSLNFIDEHADEPFFLYIPNECVHGPYDILNTDLEEMCNIVDDVYPSLAWSIVKEIESPHTGLKIKDVLALNCSSGAPYDETSAKGFRYEFDRKLIDADHPGFADLVYYTMIHSIDKATKAIVDRLEAYGLTTNTIVVFTADNGGVENIGNNFPFRGGKHTLWEGGVHVPAAIYWPGHLDANTAPYAPGDNVYTNLAQYFDWYPTLVNMAGQAVTATELDGINLTSNLFDRTPARPDEYTDSYYGMDDTWAAIRTQRWKLHYNRVPGEDQILELYDLVNDIGETTNVQASYPVERDQLIGLMDGWFASGDVTASFYPLLGNVIPAFIEPAPDGDILEITATQTNTLSNPDNQGIYIRFGAPHWLADNAPYDGYVHAGDVFQYDIYVAEDSDHVSGIYVSPTSGATPRWRSNKGGIHLDGELVMEKTLPKGRWVRMLCGMGEIAPNPAYACHIALHNPSTGNYHFYIDNVVIRRNDGTIRGVTFSDASDWSTTRYYNRSGANNVSSLADAYPDGSPYSSIALSVADLSTIPAPTNDPGTVYGSWADSIGGGIENYDPAGAGPVNNWSVTMEYGLGRDPTTYTAGLTKGTNAPTSQQLGTYAFQDLSSTNYMTMTFDFNREANDIEVVVAESSNLVDWVESVVLQPPYSDTSGLTANEQVVDVADNPGDTTRVTARSSVPLDDASENFLKLEVRPTVATPETPANLTAASYDGILLEWSGANDNGEYVVERAVSGSGVFSELARTGFQYHRDTTAVSGETYDYRVRAVNAAGATEWSDPVMVTR